MELPYSKKVHQGEYILMPSKCKLMLFSFWCLFFEHPEEIDWQNLYASFQSLLKTCHYYWDDVVIFKLHDFADGILFYLRMGC